MRNGHLQQVDNPERLYEKPANQFVAGFIGSPAMNMTEARLSRENGDVVAGFGPYRLVVDPAVVADRPALPAYEGRKVVLGIRPEDFEDAALERDVPPERRLTAHCDLTEPLGAEVLVYFTVSAAGLGAVAAESPEDAEVRLGGREDGAGPKTRLVARVSPRTRIAEGTEIELVVDTRRLYFFDPETEAAL